MLDSLDSKNTNIHDLNIEEPKPTVSEPMFDPEKDIPENIWGTLEMLVDNELGQFKNDLNAWKDYFDTATNIALLSPKRKGLARIDEAISYGLPEVFQDGSNSEAEIIKALGQVAIIDIPSRQLFNRFVGNSLMGVLWDSLGDEVKETRAKVFVDWEVNSSRLINFLEDGAAAKVCSPEKFETISSFYDAELFGLIKDNIDLAKNKFQQDEEPNFIREQAAFTSLARILYPDRFRTIQPNPEDWNRFHETFTELGRLTRWKDYLRLAVDLKILAAEELKFSEERGLEIILADPKKPLVEEIPALPEVRKF
ncbi:MAG: hypothetical protein Q7R49_01840 [Candidatus Daviesbacteria bacterium]|nr:hypothetical protein [Candidatus Daviesbacteria bacterium]